MTERDNIRAALACIPCDDRELWLRVGMALQSEYPGDDGFELFDEWSQRGDSYNARAVRDTWRSFKPGRVTIGTLWHEAKARGYRRAGPMPQEAPEVRERRQREAAERRATEAARFRARADEAARIAAKLWREASDTGSSPYLQRKGVQGHGVRYASDGTLIVPARNEAGELVNLQRIAPSKPADDRPEKTFLRFGRKAGTWHLIGTAEGAAVLLVAEGYATAASVHEATGRPVAVAWDAGNLRPVAQALAALHPAARVLIAGDDDRATEAATGKNPGRKAAQAAADAVSGAAVFPQGLAEGGSDWNDLHQSAGIEAVRLQIEAAAGELAALPVQTSAQGPSQALASRPTAGGAVADGEAPAPAAPGAETASATQPAGTPTAPAQRRRKGQAAPGDDRGPTGPPGAPQGQTVVREPAALPVQTPAPGPAPTRVSRPTAGGAVAGGEAPAAAAPGADATPAARPAGTPTAPAQRRRKGQAAADDDRGATGPAEAAPGLFDRFTLTAEGVFFTETDQDGRARSPLWVCSPLAVTARTRDADGGDWGFFLEFDDPAGIPRTWAMPARMLAGDGAEFRSVLLSMGLRIASGTKARNLLTQYLQTRQPAEVARCTDRIGWHSAAFVLPRETVQRVAGEDEAAPERIVYQTDGTSENPFRLRGTLDAWRLKVAAPCEGNSRLMFAASCAFAGPLMRPAGVDSGGFHLRGGSSCGKTTALRVAASVYGGPGYMQRWRATENALESVAAQHCDGLLILDELAQVDPKSAGEVAYMLGNEAGKARSTRSGQTRPRLTWRLLFLSAGEIGLAAHMAEGGKRARAGQELRMVDLPAEVTPGTIFETVHDHEGGAGFAVYLARATEAHHGHAGRAWLQWCVDHADELRERTRQGIERLAGRWVPDAASGQVHRVGRRFALVAVAGEMASEAGCTGWPAGSATAAAEACFLAWMAARPGGTGNAEEAQMLAQVRRWLQLNGAGRFTWWHRALDDRAPDKGLRAGFRRMVTKDGQPIAKNSDHMREFGETVEAADAEETTTDYFVFPEVFEAEACEGFDSRAVLRLLREAGHLVPDGGRSYDSKPRLPGMGHTKCYRVRSSIVSVQPRHLDAQPGALA